MALRDRYEWLIGTRYLRSGQRRGFLSFISFISMMGLMLGVAVLVVVMSVMNGFETELRARILSATSHARLMGQGETLSDWRGAQSKALSMPGVQFAVPYVEAQAMVAAGERLSGVKLRGVDPGQEMRATGLARSLTAGSLTDLEPGGFQIILGEALAAELGVKLGDKVIVVVPKGVVTPVGLKPRQKLFTVVGILSTGMYEFDRYLMLTHAKDAALLLQLGDAMTGLRLTLEDPRRAPATVRKLAEDLRDEDRGEYSITDWTVDHVNIFRNIEMTKSLLFVILSMIVGVAAFNIVATLVMVVKEKETDIAILRTLGAGPRNVLRVFTVQGVAIGTVGVAAGIALGALVSVNLESIIHGIEKLTGTHFMDAKVYLMSDLPAKVRLDDVLQVALLALFLCLLATIYPAWRASRVLPAEALRHD
jgi:lipoprotein-releasing system permease protein